MKQGMNAAIHGVSDSLATVLDAFDRLAEDASLLLAADRNPGEILEGLWRERPRSFDWFPLRQGPDRWRIRIVKRTPAVRRLTDVQRSDHRRLDGLFRWAVALAREGRRTEAADRVEEALFGLMRHVGVEETILYPEFERRSPKLAVVPAALRREHRRLNAWLDRLIDSILSGRLASLESTLEVLADILDMHFRKEEEVLYPELDCRTTPEEREALIRAIQSYQEEGHEAAETHG
jgi:uncharacterized protein (DUF2249 family)